MGVLKWMAIGLLLIGAIILFCAVLLILLACLCRPRRAPVPAAMVLDAMAEQRAPAARLPCQCLIYLLPGGDSYVTPCHRHSYMRNPDFAAWLAELDGGR